MSFIEAYKKILQQGYTKVICRYDSVKGNYEYLPFLHAHNETWKDDLVDVLINNLLNYCYEPYEIEALYKPNISQLKKYINNAIRVRLNKKTTQEQKDGLCGELLLDLILRIENQNNKLLLCRPKYQQLGSRAELKNYDALLFREEAQNISLILGQVKTGGYNYCTSNLETDLNTKYNSTYFGDAVCYIADRRMLDCPSLALQNILRQINEIAMATDDMQTRNDKICEYIKNNHIKIEIPCLMFYEKNTLYNSTNDIILQLDKEIEKVKNYFDTKSFNISNFDYIISFYVFPAKSITELRKSLMDYKKEVLHG